MSKNTPVKVQNPVQVRDASLLPPYEYSFEKLRQEIRQEMSILSRQMMLLNSVVIGNAQRQQEVWNRVVELSVNVTEATVAIDEFASAFEEHRAKQQ